MKTKPRPFVKANIINQLISFLKRGDSDSMSQLKEENDSPWKYKL